MASGGARRRRAAEIQSPAKAFDGRAGAPEIDFFLFDMPYFEGYDLRAAPLLERKRLLKAWLDAKAGVRVRYCAEFPGDPAAVLASACKLGLEGVMAKRADAAYSSRRNQSGLKLKCRLRQEFVVVGYTDRSDGASEIGSLLLGLYASNGDLVPVGSVGTGWGANEAAELKLKLIRLEIPQAPFTAGVGKPGRWSRRATGSERWVAPELVAKVEYTEMTSDGQLPHAKFLRLRADQAARSVRKEAARAPTGARRQRRTPPRSVMQGASSTRRQASPNSTWCGTTNPWPGSCFRTSKGARVRSFVGRRG